MLTNKKVRIKNREQLRVIKEKAFELGWIWGFKTVDVDNADKPFIYFFETKHMLFSDDEMEFNERVDMEEVTPEWILSLDKDSDELKTVSQSKHDNVEKPAHYNRGNIEVRDYIYDQQLNFNLGNVVKYVSRAGFKDPNKKIEDLEKALEYLRYEIEKLKRNG